MTQRHTLYSDLHNEFSRFYPPQTDKDKDTVCLLAGDIGVGKKPHTYIGFLFDCAQQYKDVLYIPGNHEYYNGGSFTVEFQKMERKLQEEFGHDVCNVHFLDNRSIVIGDVAYIGSTLWTDFQGGNPITMLTCADAMNDYKHIRAGREENPYSGRFRPEDALHRHQASRMFVFDEITKFRDQGLRTVVMTHHGPSWESVPEWAVGSPLNPAYVSMLDYEILDNGPDVWVHGHTHASLAYWIGRTRILTNTRGYQFENDPHPENPFFDPVFAFEV